MKYFFSILTLFCLTALFYSCGGDVQVKAPDVSDIQVDYRIIRWDSLILNVDTFHTARDLALLKDKHPAFYEIYFSRILPLVPNKEGDISVSMDGFLRAPISAHLKEELQKTFPHLNEQLKNELDQAFQYYKYYLPEEELPDVYTLLSEFAFQTVLFPLKENKDGVGVGLDMFLGSDYPYSNLDPQNPSFSAYITRSFDKDHMTKKIIEIMIEDKVAPVKKGQLLDYMIRNGKVLYAMDHILPMAHDSIITEYSRDQLDWAMNNEVEMFSFFLKEELFYEDETMKINKYIFPSPDSPGMPPAAPGRTANFIGWKIVESYMKRHPEVSMKALFEDQDAQYIMNESKYKPKRS